MSQLEQLKKIVRSVAKQGTKVTVTEDTFIWLKPNGQSQTVARKVCDDIIRALQAEGIEARRERKRPDDGAWAITYGPEPKYRYG